MLRRWILSLVTLAAMAAPLPADIIYTGAPGETVYVRVYTSSSASVAVALTAGTSGAIGRYAVTDAALVTAGLSNAATATYVYDVFRGSTPSTTADDQRLASGTLYWRNGVTLTEPQQFMLTTAVDYGNDTWGRALKWLETAWTSDGVYSTASLVNAPTGSGTPVSADVIDATRTWFASGYRARNIVEVKSGFIGTFAMKPAINTATTINTVSAVSITGAATVTATDLSVDRSRTMAHFTVPALSTTGTYTVVVTVTTVDGQTINTTGTLKVN